MAITDEQIRANRLAYETLRAQAAGMTIEMWQGIPVEERGAVLAGAQQDARQRKAIAARQARAAAAAATPTSSTTTSTTTSPRPTPTAATKPTDRLVYDQKYRVTHRQQINARQNAERDEKRQVKADE